MHTFLRTEMRVLFFDKWNSSSSSFIHLLLRRTLPWHWSPGVQLHNSAFSFPLNTSNLFSLQPTQTLRCHRRRESSLPITVLPTPNANTRLFRLCHCRRRPHPGVAMAAAAAASHQFNASGVKLHSLHDPAHSNTHTLTHTQHRNLLNVLIELHPEKRSCNRWK